MLSFQQSRSAARLFYASRKTQEVIKARSLLWWLQVRTSTRGNPRCHPPSWLKLRDHIQNWRFIPTTKCSKPKASWTPISSIKSSRTWINNFNNCRFKTNTALRTKNCSITSKTTTRYPKATSLRLASWVSRKKNKCAKLGAKWSLKSWLSSCPYLSATSTASLSRKSPLHSVLQQKGISTVSKIGAAEETNR